MTEKDFRLVPCGDKSLGISPRMEPENGREEQHAELRGLFLLTMKRKFVFLKTPPSISAAGDGKNIPKGCWNFNQACFVLGLSFFTCERFASFITFWGFFSTPLISFVVSFLLCFAALGAK